VAVARAGARRSLLVTSREVLGFPANGRSFSRRSPIGMPCGSSVRAPKAADRQSARGFNDIDLIRRLVDLLTACRWRSNWRQLGSGDEPAGDVSIECTSGFRLLSSTGGRLDRQSTLRGALDWSWERVAGRAGALAQLSVFRGGFTLVAAER